MRNILSAALIALALPASAQDNDWTYTATIYAWVPDLGGTVGTPFGDVEFEGGGSDIISTLDMAFMGTFEARNGRWGILGDAMYADLSDSEPAPFGALHSSADMSVKLGVLSGYGLYRVVENTNVKVDLAAGLRYYAMDIDVDLSAGTLPASNVISASESWVDPLVGMRASYKFSDNWSLSGAADIGGFGIGSDLTWQAIATIDYNFNQKWSARLGYRYLEIDKPVNGIDVELRLSGPIIGATYHF